MVWWFLCPVSKNQRHIVFGLSVHLSVCLSAKTLTLAISFELQVIGISYVCSLWQDLSIDAKIFDLVTLTLMFVPLLQSFNIGHIFWMVSDMAFIFHIRWIKKVWPVSTGCLLLLGTWSYLRFCRRSVLPYTWFCNCLLDYGYILHIINFAILYVFLMARPLRLYLYQKFCPCDIDLEVWPTFQKL
jgi:hypothetical protein